MSEDSREYRLSPKSRSDLEEIWAYTYETRSLKQADYYHGQIIAALDVLAESPDQGLDIAHVRPDYRRWTVGLHYIFYRKTSYGIEVIRILHQKRDIPRHL